MYKMFKNMIYLFENIEKSCKKQTIEKQNIDFSKLIKQNYKFRKI